MRFRRCKEMIRLGSFALILFLALLFCVTERLILNPHYGAVLYKLGMECNEKCGQRERFKYFQKAVYYDPTLSDAYYQLGIIYGERGNREEEIANYRKVTRFDHNHQKAWAKVGIDYYKAGDFEYAVRYLKQAFYLGHTLVKRMTWLTNWMNI